MVYKYHQKWRELRDRRGQDSASDVWDICDLPEEEKKLVKNMRKSRPIIPYTLEVECTSYWGNFEREFLGYAIGILDDVQMHIDHSEEERTMFWKEVFGRESISFKEAYESYELYKDYLLETFQECDDWEQLTFYTIDWDIMHKNGSNVLKIQLAKPLSREWEEIIIPRMRAFFNKKIYKYLNPEDDIISITLCDRKGNVIKEY
jgi:hypothetical protein